MGREVRTKAQAVEITRLRAEAEIKSDAIQRLRKQRDELLGERDSLTALIPGSYYMDPPDGGDVPVVEQFRRMAKDAERWRCLIRHASPHPRAVPVEMALCPLTVQFWAADLIAEFSAALARAEAAESALIRNGYRKSCSIPACNCGDQWNHGGHASERLAEISAALRNSPVEMNGNTLLGGVQELAERTDKAEAERDAAIAKLARYETLQHEANTDWYVQTVSSHCDRIIWRGRYYNLPLPDVKEKAK